MKNKWLEIKNSVSGDKTTAELMIYGEIGDWWDGLDANTLAQAIRDSDSDIINIRMLTYGGSLVTALGVYNVMKASGKKFIIHNDGVIASAGTIIASAGEVHMPKNAMYMVHSALTGAYGNAKELREIADMLEKFDGGIKSIYKDKTNLSDEEIDNLLSKDTWLNAEEAKNLGLIDVITNDIKIAANASGKDTIINGITLPKLDAKNLPKTLLNNVKSNEAQPKEGDKPMNLAEFKANHGDIANQFKVEIENSINTKVEDAIKNERERILNIQEATLEGQEELAQQAIENGTDASVFAISAIKAHKQAEAQKGANVLAGLENDAIQAGKVVNTAVTAETKQPETQEDKLMNALEAELIK